MKRILIVDDSKTICSFLARRIKESLDFEVDVAYSFSEAKALVDKSSDYLLALLDVHLEDMNDATMANYMVEKDIPVLIMTGDYDKNTLKLFRDVDVIDYVLKESPESIAYIISLISRVAQNSETKVLVVDDSVTFRKELTKYLKSQLYNVLVATHPLEALQTMEKNRDIKMIISDYNMPNLNGVEFLKVIRQNFSKNEVAVIGISTDEDSAISFLKYGANDFVTKPFFREEFICRVNNTAESLENVNKLEEIANMDYLTKIANRKYFFEKAEESFQNLKVNNKPVALAMIDIDNFKFINDTYGHSIGDEVIKALAKILHDNIKGKDIVARFGGEEFVLYLEDTNDESASLFMQHLCKKIAKHTIEHPDGFSINFTVSIGLATKKKLSLVDMINDSDELLYAAKNSGKNKVVSDLVTV